MAADQRAAQARLSRRPPALILASASPRRRALLRSFGLPFRVDEPRVDELDGAGLPPTRVVRHNARAKADAVARRARAGVVIAADTIVVLDGRIFGKPKTPADAARMLRALQGRAHHVYTGVCIRRVQPPAEWIDVARSTVTLRRLSAGDIRRHARNAAHHDKAGAYAVQDLAAMVVSRVSGSLSNVIGLPLELVERRLRQCGVLPDGVDGR